jgi:hypothetical protein
LSPPGSLQSFFWLRLMCVQHDRCNTKEDKIHACMLVAFIFSKVKYKVKTESVSAGACAGHWKLGHTVKNLILTQMQMLCTFALFSLVKESKGLFTSFGFVDQQPAFIAYTLFSIISAPVNEVSSLQ